MQEEKSCSVPAIALLTLQRPEDEQAQLAMQLPHMEIVEAPLYCSVSTNPDIAYIVRVSSRYMSCFTSAHCQAAKGVLHNLCGAVHYTLCLQGSKELQLEGCCNAG